MGLALEHHALFEALQEARLQADPSAWSWRSWPVEWRDPESEAVRRFAEKNQREILFHIFLQWVADRSFGATQQQRKNAGMRIGLVSDLAVGMSSGGSHAWTNQSDVLRVSKLARRLICSTERDKIGGSPLFLRRLSHVMALLPSS